VLEEQGARPLRAIVDYDEALMYVRRGRRGDRNRAAPLVEAALAQFRQIGMTGWIKRGEELQRQIAERMAGQKVLPDRLTPREVDVLRLIARGRTTTEIASDLTLSVRTVGRHVTNLYNKIEARNRAEAVDYAHRHDLT
jgi:DNA-binding NarL/FixJ family response regulator